MPPQAAGGDLVVRFSFTPRLTGGDYMLALGIAQIDPQRGAIAIDRRYSAATLNVRNTAPLVGIVDMDVAIDLVT
jgi:hypothetical protein